MKKHVKKSKKMIAILITIALILSGCSGGQDASSNTDKEKTKNIKVVATFYPIYIAALNVIGDTDGVELSSLTQPTTGCLHDFQLAPKDMAALEDADLLIANGAGMESFLDKAIALYPELNVLTLTDGMKLLDGNPHVWTSIDLYMEEIRSIQKEMCTLDPKNKDQYTANADAYLKKLSALKQDFASIQKENQTTSKNIIIFHDAFAYLAKDLGLHVVKSIEIEGDNTTFSAAETASIIDEAKADHVQLLFCEAQYSTGMVDTIANETGAKAYVLDSCVTGEMNKDAYLNAMEHNISILKEALK